MSRQHVIRQAWNGKRRLQMKCDWDCGGSLRQHSSESMPAATWNLRLLAAAGIGVEGSLQGQMDSVQAYHGAGVNLEALPHWYILHKKHR